MKMLTEAQLKELLNRAWEDGFIHHALNGGIAADDAKDDRDADVTELMKEV